VTSCVCGQERIYGRAGSRFVSTGNATADVVSLVLLPMCTWLDIYWVIENPVSKLKQWGSKVVSLQ
jgi:hypothetical protein